MEGRGAGLGVRSACIGLILIAPAPALAAEQTAPTGASLADDRVVSLTVSPVHLVLPLFEVTAEARLVPGLGAAAIVGAGSLAIDANDPSVDGDRASVYELGAQVVGYPIAPFRSLELGVEAVWLHASLPEEAGVHVSATGQGLAVGPFLGYKVLTSGGFTFVVQGGAQYLALRAESSEQSAEDKRVIGLVNLNLGWSF
jgi:hypothetical protein